MAKYSPVSEPQYKNDHRGERRTAIDPMTIAARPRAADLVIRPRNRPPYLKGYPPSSARSDTNYFSRRPLCLADGPPLFRVLRGTARGRGVGLPGLYV